MLGLEFFRQHQMLMFAYSVELSGIRKHSRLNVPFIEMSGNLSYTDGARHSQTWALYM